MELPMEDMIPIVSAACGLMSWVLFTRLEPRSIPLILSLLFLPSASVLWVFYGFPFPSQFPFSIPSSTLFIYLKSLPICYGTLILTTIVYRLSPFHPLAGYPGPVICRLTRLWTVYSAWTGKQHLYYKRLHDEYGAYVRTGPNHLHICDASVLQTVMGTKPFLRGERYQLLRPTGGSLISVMDPTEHAQRRKVWELGLTSSAIEGYSDALAKRVGQLINVLEKRTGRDVDLAGWLSCLSFDFMGDLAFGGAFHLLDAGEDPNCSTAPQGRALGKLPELMANIPWSARFFIALRLNRSTRKNREFAKQSILERKEKGSSRRDLFYYLLDEAGLGNPVPPSLDILTSEAALAIVAGSDTTGTALSNLFYYLLMNPDVYTKLQAEVDREFPKGADVLADGNATTMRGMKYLNAVINETLRLKPAILNGIQRRLIKGSGGAVLPGERFVPEGTTVQIAAYSLHTSPQYFSPDPEKWMPERWITTNPYNILNQSAFIPFSFGPTNCVGKNLAIYELRTVTCSLIQKFNFVFAPGYDTKQWEKQIVDRGIIHKGDLPVRVVPRY